MALAAPAQGGQAQTQAHRRASLVLLEVAVEGLGSASTLVSDVLLLFVTASSAAGLALCGAV
jgi:hypothetical protein